MEVQARYAGSFSRFLGALEIIVGAVASGYGLYVLRDVYLFPMEERNLEGWRALQGGVSLWTGIALLIAGLCLI